MTRRRFAFWIGFGLFTLGERLNAQSLDALAALGMKLTSDERWTAAENGSWRWYQRERMVDGDWRVTGITTPVNKWSGEEKGGVEGYLDASLVPDEVLDAAPTDIDEEYEDEHLAGQADPARRARHGRPPSRWLRSLHAEELACWLSTITVPEAGVSGMMVLVHLTRDHSFAESRLDGLTEDELYKLHAAAHYGY